MRSIWKYELEPWESEKMIPKDSEIISLQMQDGRICFWAFVETTAEKVSRKFTIIGTGSNIRHNKIDLDFIGTVQEPGLVWHIFEVNSELSKARKAKREIFGDS